jgi:hypothetical protein
VVLLTGGGGFGAAGTGVLVAVAAASARLACSWTRPEEYRNASPNPASEENAASLLPPLAAVIWSRIEFRFDVLLASEPSPVVPDGMVIVAVKPFAVTTVYVVVLVSVFKTAVTTAPLAVVCVFVYCGIFLILYRI